MVSRTMPRLFRNVVVVLRPGSLRPPSLDPQESFPVAADLRHQRHHRYSPACFTMVLEVLLSRALLQYYFSRSDGRGKQSGVRIVVLS